MQAKKLEFLRGCTQPPPNYVAGVGRGATGFITRCDIGPNLAIRSVAAKKREFLHTKPPPNYVAGLIPGATGFIGPLLPAPNLAIRTVADKKTEFLRTNYVAGLGRGLTTRSDIGPAPDRSAAAVGPRAYDDNQKLDDFEGNDAGFEDYDDDDDEDKEGDVGKIGGRRGLKRKRKSMQPQIRKLQTSLRTSKGN